MTRQTNREKQPRLGVKNSGQGGSTALEWTVPRRILTSPALPAIPRPVFPSPGCDGVQFVEARILRYHTAGLYMPQHMRHPSLMNIYRVCCMFSAVELNRQKLLIDASGHESSLTNHIHYGHF